MERVIKALENHLSYSSKQINQTISLHNEGATIPFIARYRKEWTGGLDEIQIAEIVDLFTRYKEIAQRQNTIIKTIDEQGKLDTQLQETLLNTWKESTLEDLYLPYKPKRKTKAEKARQNGLEPMAKILMKQDSIPIDEYASRYTCNEYSSTDSVIEGAGHIIAEWINENQWVRDRLRLLFSKEAFLSSKVKKQADSELKERYKDYWEFSQIAKKCPSYRLLAIFRGENEGILNCKVLPDEERALEVLERKFIRSNNQTTPFIERFVKDAYKRLLAPSLETELRNELKQQADEKAIDVFAQNLEELLMAPPLGSARILAIDPGFRTGCKLVCLDEQGTLLHNETIYPHPPKKESKQAVRKLDLLVEQYKIDAIAIGNGTAGRETENLVKHIRFKKEVKVFSVNEAGASVYSASSVARKEFPNYDVTVRGAVSIGRRLMDPLAELVKIDPKSIGVGQYQHDVDQQLLKTRLDRVVESCVNRVGVNLNTASHHLLAYISGLSAKQAENIYTFRQKNGPFLNRQQLKSVDGIGNKAFEQSAGFLRIRKGDHPLDNTAVHPENYSIIEKLAKGNSMSMNDFIDQKQIKNIKPEALRDTTLGTYTWQDIVSELDKPGRDIRQTIKVFDFDPTIKNIEDLQVGMILPGIITNVTHFGAFVDIGLKQNGLVHKSEIANEFVDDPTQYVKVNQTLQVKVLEIDIPRKRIGLSIKQAL